MAGTPEDLRPAHRPVGRPRRAGRLGRRRAPGWRAGAPPPRRV